LADDLPDPLPVGKVGVKSYFPRKKNLLVPDDWMALFLSFVDGTMYLTHYPKPKAGVFAPFFQ